MKPYEELNSITIPETGQIYDSDRLKEYRAITVSLDDENSFLATPLEFQRDEYFSLSECIELLSFCNFYQLEDWGGVKMVHKIDTYEAIEALGMDCDEVPTECRLKFLDYQGDRYVPSDLLFTTINWLVGINRISMFKKNVSFAFVM